MTPRRSASSLAALPTAALAAALLSPAMPATAQARDLDAAVQEALERAREPLLAHLRTATRESDPGQLGLLCLATLHDGVSADDKVLAPALGRLAAADPEQTYALALRLLVAEACTSFPDRLAIARADTKELLQHRRGGAFAYTADGGAWDLSNTQYAALGLRAAVSIGVDVERRIWSRLADEVGGAQRYGGGFGYHKGGDDAYASMTAAGIGVLSICKQHLGGDNAMAKLDARLRKAWGWMNQHGAAIGDPKERWSSYFHYGLERAAILEDVTEVGGRDWYGVGARMFVDLQLPGGGWSNAQLLAAAAASAPIGVPVDTAFAVLFLRRRFQKIAAPLTAPRTIVLAMLNAQSTATEVDACAAGLARRGVTALPDILQALRGELRPPRRAAALALRAITGQDFGIDPERDAEHNLAALRQAELWYLKHR